MRTYSLSEVADMVLPEEWVGGERWLVRKLARGEIRGYRLNHRVWRMTEQHITELITHFENVAGTAVEAATQTPAVPATPITDGLSPRARRRLRSA